MSISFDTSGQKVSAGTGATLSYTTSATANRVMLVGLSVNAGDLLTSVTYNAVSLTQLFKGQAGNGAAFYWYYLFNPSSGTNNVVANQSGSGDIGYAVATYTGVAQSFDSSNSGTYGATTTESISTTVVASNCWVVGFRGGNRIPTTTTGTQRQQVSANNETAHSDSNGTVGTGSQSLAWSSTTEPTTSNQMYIVSLAPAAAATGSSTFLPFF